MRVIDGRLIARFPLPLPLEPFIITGILGTSPPSPFKLFGIYHFNALFIVILSNVSLESRQYNKLIEHLLHYHFLNLREKMKYC